MKSREGKIRAARREIAAIVEDWRSKAAGGLETALMLWLSCCLSSLLAGAGTWVEMTKATEKKLASLQNSFLRLILPALGHGLLDMGLLICREKLMLMIP